MNAKQYLIDHLKLANEEVGKINRLSWPWQFIFYANKFLGAKYKMGAENLFQTDCSGLVCGTFLLMGYNIRTNANDLYNRIFTRDANAGDKHYEAIQAYFFKLRSESVVSHVSAIVGRGVIIDAVETAQPVMLKAADRVIGYYDRQHYDVFRRKVDMVRLQQLSEREEASWDVDDFYEKIRRMV